MTAGAVATGAPQSTPLGLSRAHDGRGRAVTDDAGDASASGRVRSTSVVHAFAPWRSVSWLRGARKSRRSTDSDDSRRSDAVEHPNGFGKLFASRLSRSSRQSRASEDASSSEDEDAPAEASASWIARRRDGVRSRAHTVSGIFAVGRTSGRSSRADAADDKPSPPRGSPGASGATSGRSAAGAGDGASMVTSGGARQWPSGRMRAATSAAAEAALQIQQAVGVRQRLSRFEVKVEDPPMVPTAPAVPSLGGRVERATSTDSVGLGLEDRSSVGSQSGFSPRARFLSTPV